jgi:pyruvyl transferase EpsO
VKGTTGAIRSLNLEIDRALAPALAGRDRVALLDFPDHANVGDSAIWLGELRALRRLGFRAPCYICSAETYSAAALARRLGGGAILLSGGGNLGDLWPTHQDFREQVLADFPDHRVVQLPQSIHFQSRELLQRAREVFQGHGDFTLLLRDKESLAHAGREFDVPSMLCPDMALALGSLARPTQAAVPVLWHSRNDKEAPRLADRDRLSAQYGPPHDWLVDAPSPVIRLYGRLNQLRRRYPGVFRQPALGRLHGRIAWARLRRGLLFLSQGEAVVTNRLHGHILSFLMGIPHYVSDNSYGKVRSFIETWTAASEHVTLCATEAEALARAHGERVAS